MRNTFYGILAVGLLLFLSSNIHANSTSDCKPSVHIQPVKGNYIPLLNGDIEILEKFLLDLSEQNANYCKVSLKIDFKKGLETKQTITRGKPKYNEKLFLEVQYFSPSYEAIIESAEGDILHKIELGKELKSLEYSNPELNNHDALYAEWRRIRSGNFSQIETDANNFQALIDFLKMENGISISENTSLAMIEKEEVLAPKGAIAKVEKKENTTRKNKKNRASKKSKSTTKVAKEETKEIGTSKTQPLPKDSASKAEKKSKSTTKVAKEETKEIATSKTQPLPKDSASKAEKKSKSTTKIAKEETKEIATSKTQPLPKDSASKAEKKSKSTTKIAKEETKEIATSKTQPLPKDSVSKAEKKSKTNVRVEEKAKSEATKSESKPSPKTNKTQKSSEPREIISDDEMFGNAGVIEPLAKMVRFEFPYGKNYKIINESDFSIKINTGRESGKVFADNNIKANQEKKVKNKFKNGDWYSIEYPEKLHKKDVEDYKKSIESILSDLDLSDFEDDFFKMSEQLIPNLDIITNENPLADKSQRSKVEVRFQKFIAEKGIEVFKENQQQEAATQLESLLTLIVQSHRLHQYYKYTVGSSAAHRPVNKLPRFRKN